MTQSSADPHDAAAEAYLAWATPNNLVYKSRQDVFLDGYAAASAAQAEAVAAERELHVALARELQETRAGARVLLDSITLHSVRSGYGVLSVSAYAMNALRALLPEEAQE